MSTRDVADIIQTRGVGNLTAKTLRIELEAKLGLDAGAIRPHHKKLSEVIDDVLEYVDADGVLDEQVLSLSPTKWIGPITAAGIKRNRMVIDQTAEEQSKILRMHSLPNDLLVHMCSFFCVATLMRLRETCLHWRLIATDQQAWINAIYDNRSVWYGLKDIGLTAKFMRCIWANRAQRTKPPPLDHMANIAFWGTIVDGDRLLATFGPCVTNLWPQIEFFDLPGQGWGNPELIWCSAPMALEWTDQDTYDKYIEMKPCVHLPDIHYHPGWRWSSLSTVTVDVYALVVHDNAISMHEFVSGPLVPRGGAAGVLDPGNHDWGRLNLLGTDDGSKNFTIQDCAMVLQLTDDQPAGFSQEWKDEWEESVETKRLEMEALFAQSSVNRGRGWYGNRQDAVRAISKQLDISAGFCAL